MRSSICRPISARAWPNNSAKIKNCSPAPAGFFLIKNKSPLGLISSQEGSISGAGPPVTACRVLNLLINPVCIRRQIPDLLCCDDESLYFASLLGRLGQFLFFVFLTMFLSFFVQFIFLFCLFDSSRRLECCAKQGIAGSVFGSCHAALRARDVKVQSNLAILLAAV